MNSTIGSPYGRGWVFGVRLAQLCAVFGLVSFLSANAKAASGSDNAGNYNYTGDLSWTNGANGGTGFGPWEFENNNNDTNRYAGTYLANSNNPGGRNLGIFSPDESGKAFILYAHPAGAYMNAKRNFGGSSAVPLAVGESFTFKWLQYWGNGDKGINFYRNGWDENNDRTLSLRQSGDQFIAQPRGSSNSPVAISNAFNNVTTVRLRRAAPDTLVLTVQTDEVDDGSYTNTFRAPAPDRVKFYYANGPAGADETNPRPLFNNLSITPDSTPVTTRSIKFNVNMSVLEGQTPKRFDPAGGDKVYVRGYPSGGWGDSEKVQLTQETGSVYSATLPVAGDTGMKSGGYKFFIEYGVVSTTVVDNGGYETSPDREFDLPSNDTNLPVVYFSNLLPSRSVTFAVDMNVQISKGAFAPTSGQAVELKGSYNGGWTAPGVLMTDPEGDGIYTVTVPIQGNPGDSIEYKFNTTGPGATGWETVASNRTLVLGGVAETLRPVTFSNEGTTFAVWSGGATLNSANLAKYAIGGATSLTSSDGKAPTAGSDATTLTLTAIVRDDASLSVVGEAVTNLTDYAPGGSITTLNGSDLGVDQTGVPSGCKRKVFSVNRGTDDRKFLRIRVTK